MTGLEVGSQIDLALFQEGDKVKITGTSKGKGTAGVIKKYGYALGAMSHGGGYPHRLIGSMGGGRGTNQGVPKGKKMPGRMGNERLREMADQLFPEANQPKGFNEGELTASNIGQKDFDEIISLIQQGTSGKPGKGMYRLFEGRKDGKNFLLNIPVTHSDLTNIPFAGQESNDNKKEKNLRLILKTLVFDKEQQFVRADRTKEIKITDTKFLGKKLKKINEDLKKEIFLKLRSEIKMMSTAMSATALNLPKT
ncbi:11387_t:CDS:2 [Paraglomus brasilianum]|uniref:Large ribosomal subunit protein uL3c n=1 Tax=Paraglomus brasilianum TaxID=144538 RepID=A0A9N9FNR1_9GLOM|nr:11387_t:CDS:2 [Paraglomus brasilianum]